MNNKSVISALTFKFTERIAVKAIGFVISVILARLLAPQIFGVIAIILAVVAIMQVFVDNGLNTALIQNKNTDKSDYSTIFYLSMAVALVIYIALFLLSPAITTYFNITEYLLHFRVLSLMLLFYSFNSIQAAKLTREMQFKKMLFCQLITTIISGIVGVGAAYAGLGIWALIVYYIANSAVSCVVYVFVSNWHPELIFSVNRAKELFDYGYKLLLSGLLCSLFANIRTFIIGKLYSKADLGLYSRGDQIPSIISATIDGAFNSVMLPVFSQQQDSSDTIYAMLRKTIALNSYINFPSMLGLAAIAPTAVILLYTQKWEACIPYLQLLSLADLHISVASPCLIAIKASGHSGIYLKLEIVRRLIMLCVLGVSLCFHSLTAIAVGWVISTVIDVFVVLVPTHKLIGYSSRDLYSDVGSTLLLSFVMSGTVWFVGMLQLPMFLLLLAQMLCGIVVYIGLSAVFKLKSYIAIKSILFSKVTPTDSAR